MRLIDADELLEDYESYGHTSPIALTFIDDLKEMPTVEERKHGHWIKVNRCFGSDLLRCSNCKKSVLKNYSPAFCEYCGAIMNKVSKDV